MDGHLGFAQCEFLSLARGYVCFLSAYFFGAEHGRQLLQWPGEVSGCAFKLAQG